MKLETSDTCAVIFVTFMKWLAFLLVCSAASSHAWFLTCWFSLKFLYFTLLVGNPVGDWERK